MLVRSSRAALRCFLVDAGSLAGGGAAACMLCSTADCCTAQLIDALYRMSAPDAPTAKICVTALSK